MHHVCLAPDWHQPSEIARLLNRDASWVEPNIEQRPSVRNDLFRKVYLEMIGDAAKCAERAVIAA